MAGEETNTDTTKTEEGAAKVDSAKKEDKSGGAKISQQTNGSDTGKNSHNDDESDSWMDSLPEDKQKWIKKLRSEAAGNRVKTRDLEDKLAKIQTDKEAEEQEKLKEQNKWKELAEAKDQKLAAFNDRIIRTELKLFAQREGIIDPKDVEIIPLENVKLLASGDVSGAEEAVKALKKERPHWFKTSDDEKPPESTGSTKEPGGASAPSVTKDVSKMTPEQFDTYTKELVKGLRK